MTEDGAQSPRQHGCHQRAVPRQSRPPNRVDAAPAGGMEAPPFKPVVDRLRVEAQLKQLSPGDHAVLPGGERPYARAAG